VKDSNIEELEGAVSKKRKKGGKVMGAKSKKRLDKKARGGVISPGSALSGAAPTKMRPDFKEKAAVDKEND
jgi:hypothetical protein